MPALTSLGSPSVALLPYSLASAYAGCFSRPYSSASLLPIHALGLATGFGNLRLSPGTSVKVFGSKRLTFAVSWLLVAARFGPHELSAAGSAGRCS
jgi:hypothetical protein